MSNALYSLGILRCIFRRHTDEPDRILSVFDSDLCHVWKMGLSLAPSSSVVSGFIVSHEIHVLRFLPNTRHGRRDAVLERRGQGGQGAQAHGRGAEDGEWVPGAPQLRERTDDR